MNNKNNFSVIKNNIIHWYKLQDILFFQISWSKKNGLLDSGDKFVVGGVYTMRNISQYQSGVYICQASNGVGYPVIQNINLTVLCKYG